MTANMCCWVYSNKNVSGQLSVMQMAGMKIGEDFKIRILTSWGLSFRMFRVLILRKE